VEQWKKRDPIKLFRARVVAEGTLTAAEMDAIDAKIKKDMEAAVEFARQSPEPEVEMAMQDIFTE
jgi:TPP-dependent pyruvate/acetoin dehydrogenase alpha subunit